MSQSKLILFLTNSSFIDAVLILFLNFSAPPRLTKVVRGAPERNGPVNFSQAELDMYLSAFKFLDTSLAFPPEMIPVFQM